MSTTITRIRLSNCKFIDEGEGVWRSTPDRENCNEFYKFRFEVLDQEDWETLNAAVNAEIEKLDVLTANVLDITPYDYCSTDEEKLFRAYVDATGRIPLSNPINGRPIFPVPLNCATSSDALRYASASQIDPAKVTGARIGENLKGRYCSISCRVYSTEIGKVYLLVDYLDFIPTDDEVAEPVAATTFDNDF